MYKYYIVTKMLQKRVPIIYTDDLRDIEFFQHEI